MVTHVNRSLSLTRVIAVILLCLTLVSVRVPVARAEQTIRVGYYYAENFQEGMSDSSVKRGYAYEYLQALAEYTGWHYEYVYSDQSTLYDMLADGDIDLLAGLARTPDREQAVAFPDRAMGTETYTIYTLLGSRVTLRGGVRVGSVRRSARSDQLRAWARDNHISINISEFRDDAAMSSALVAGWVDAVVEADNSIDSSENLYPLERVGAADYFLCASYASGIVDRINAAQNSLFADRSVYLRELQDYYFARSAVHAILSADESAYVAEHPVINIGYIENYMPLCDVAEDGSPIGILPDVVADISVALNLRGHLSFNFVPFASLNDLRQALRGGAVDIIYPVTNSSWHSENMRVALSNTISSVAVSLVYKNYDEHMTDVIAINELDPIARVYAETYYPDARLLSFLGDEATLDAVLSGRAACTLVNDFRSRDLLAPRRYAALSTVELSQPARVSFGVRVNDNVLRSLLNRGISQLDASRLQSQLVARVESMRKFSIWDFVMQHLVLVITVSSVVLLLIIGLFATQVFILRRKNDQLVSANTARIAAEKETLRMLHSIEIDELTGVYTCQAFFAHCQDTFRANPDVDYDLWISDVENFKLVNSMYGGPAGDRLLRYIAANLSARLPDTLIGHYNADHFAVLIPHDRSIDLNDAVALADHLAGNSPIPRTVVKFGAYRKVDKSLAMALNCDRAMVALQSLRGSFDAIVAEYDDPRIADLQRAGEMESAFSEALENSEFIVRYQPKYSLRSATMVGAEALVRWCRADGTVIPPSEFITLFERDGLIRRLDEYVFNRVCADIRSWIDRGLYPVPVSVNLSRVTLRDDHIAERYAGIARRHGVSLSLLAIELTESAGVSDDSVRPFVHAFTDYGFALHLDDFGSGYSSLSVINALPFNTVKLDKTLIDGITEQGGEEVLRHVIEMCHFKSMPVVAEGVEKQYQIDALTRLSCDMIQGYYFSPAVDFEEFSAMLIATNRPAVPIENDVDPIKVSRDSLVGYLTALGNIYSCVLIFDLEEDTMLEYSSTVYIRNYINHHNNAAAQLKEAIRHLVTPEYLDAALEFCDLSTLRERLGGARNLVEDFIDNLFGWVRVQFITVSYDSANLPREVMFTTRVVEKEKRRESELIEASRTDVLTGLNNRRAFSEDSLKFSDPNDDALPNAYTVISMDVNDLKLINDTYGHTAGDELLRGAAECMTHAFGAIGSIYRIGGDEFFAVVSEADAPAALESFRRYIKQWYGIRVSSMRVACGMASLSETVTRTLEETIALADTRMYADKRAQKM